MPKLPGVNHQEAIRALEKAGFRIARQGAKRAVMTDGIRFLTIPRHNPVNAFTMGGRDRSRRRVNNRTVQEVAVNRRGMLQRTRRPRIRSGRSLCSPLNALPLAAICRRLPIAVLMIPILSVVCRGEDLQKGLVPGLSGDMVVYRGAINPRSAVYPGYERVAYRLNAAYPAEAVIGSISSDLARRGWRPLRNNWHNRDEASEYVRGWIQSTVVSKPGGKERYFCRWWAQWRNAEGEIVDYALGYLSPTEQFTNRSQLDVSATRMSVSVAQRSTPAYARGQEVFELPVGTPPNSATATDNPPDRHSSQVRPDGEQPCATGAISLIDGKWYQSSIYPAQLAGTPTWRPDLEPQPPLSPGQAVVLARREIRRLFPMIKDWQVTEVTLSWTWQPEHWYYHIIFNRFSTEPRPGERIPTFPILVLMNGKVIQPTVRPEPSAPVASAPPAS